uniref:Uncharacterized protein n=1 Tax=Aegilops tauschii TaxID=37682 RepID=N1QVB5_AEGTA
MAPYNHHSPSPARLKQRVMIDRDVQHGSQATHALNLDDGIIFARTASASLEREERAINRRNGLHAVQGAYAAAEEKRCALEEEQFGRLPHRDGSASTFEEKQFGYLVGHCQEYYLTCANITRDLSSIVISIALFDGDKMLFACSGICVSYGSTQFQLTRFATSARLVTAYNENMNKDDNLRIDVRLPRNAMTEGFLGLYDRDIAIVTTAGLPNVRSVELDLQAQAVPTSPGSRILAAGRSFTSASLMAMRGSICMEHPSRWISDDGQHITEAALGGPLISDDGRFLGMNLDNKESEANTVYSFFISRGLLYQRLKHFQILDPEEFDIRAYSLPSGVSTIVPSGFRKSINRLKSQGYPMPPPLVLEFNSELLDHFEEQFGELRAWKGILEVFFVHRLVYKVAWKQRHTLSHSDFGQFG